jgi:hypothetical protein
MYPRSFDTVTRFFATRRSRRHAIAAAGSGLAVLGSRWPAGAHDAIPVAPPGLGEAEGTAATELFVQSFDSGSFAPKPGEADVFVLTLQGEHGRTIAFTDRPRRLVHSIPTQNFVDGLGFTPANPPNAALVMEPSPGETDIVVLELLNPQYDAATQSLTYDVIILDTFTTERGLTFQETPRQPDPAGEDFGLAQLFIDGCSPFVACATIIDNSGEYVGMLPGGPVSACFGEWDNCDPSKCDPPGPTLNDLVQVCTSTYGSKCVNNFCYAI